MGPHTAAISKKRLCSACKMYKPDRAHHCTKCGRCVLNMDHHCVFLNNCIGFYNRKFFMQALFYGYLTLLVVAATCTPEVVRRCRSLGPFGFILGFDTLAVLLCVSLLLLFILTQYIRYQLKLVLYN